MADLLADELTVCECCALMIANGDESGCVYYLGHAPHAMSKPSVAGYFVLSEDEPTEHWSRWPLVCDGCGQEQLQGATILPASAISY